jgi:hypothetical protein
MYVKLHHRMMPVITGTPKDTRIRRINERTGLDLFEGGVG